MDVSIFEERESNVRSYSRTFPTVFQKAQGAIIHDEAGKPFIDFFAGAGALNYGHNNEYIKERIIKYIDANGISHALDMYTCAKRDFLEQFYNLVLRPKDLDYKVQFCGPTGANAVEAGLKLARKVKQRTGVFSFMGGYHGVSLGSLAVSGNAEFRASAGVPLGNVTFMPYPYGFMATFDTIQYIETVLEDTHSGIEKPAAIIFETIQAEGGVVVAPVEWMRRLRDLCDRHDILLICDDIQVGCGRTGAFFSFERAGIVPDIVTLSKSISGYGMPMSLLLFRSDLDVWKPAEHTGTFRGNQLAFVGATAALEYAAQVDLMGQVKQKERVLEDFLVNEVLPLNEHIRVRGAGMIWGIDLGQAGGAAVAAKVIRACFESGLIIERAGRHDTVIKILPPLTIEPDLLAEGCRRLKQALVQHLGVS